jgi:hypothetical protein
MLSVFAVTMETTEEILQIVMGELIPKVDDFHLGRLNQRPTS